MRRMIAAVLFAGVAVVAAQMTNPRVVVVDADQPMPWILPDLTNYIETGDDASLNSLTVTSNVTAQTVSASGAVSAGSASVASNLVVDTDVLFVDSVNNNRVGIGTTTPASLFEIVATSANQGLIRLKGTSGGLAKLQVVDTAGGLIHVGSTDNRPVEVVVNNVAAMRFAQNTRNVGIGTNAPAEKLHVTGNILASGNVTAASYIAGSSAGITTNVVVDGKTLEFTHGILTGVTP